MPSGSVSFTAGHVGVGGGSLADLGGEGAGTGEGAVDLNGQRRGACAHGDDILHAGNYLGVDPHQLVVGVGRSGQGGLGSTFHRSQVTAFE